MFVQSVSYSAAFIAGLLSFFSPCIVPLVPAYFTFLTGFSLEELTSAEPGRIRGKVVLSTLAFVLGFSIIFILLGASASILGGLAIQYKGPLRVLGGAVIIVLGLHLSGLFRLKFLDVEKRLHLNKKPVHFLGTLLVGMAFAAGWTPCIGPLLGSILAVAAGQDTVGQGVILLAIYSAGLAIPFLIVSLFVHLVLAFVRRGVKYLKYVNAVAGMLLVGLGVLLIADKLRIIQ
ncbi:MAG: cytochrome c biogenesis protein CcdA [Thermodesulfobacteriota bacterium]